MKNHGLRKKLKWIAIGLFAFTVLVCAGVPTLLWFRGGGTVNIAVDYAAKLDELAAAVPESDRAWPYYREASIGLSALQEVDRELLRDPESWMAEEARLRQVLDETRPQLDLIREGSKKPGMGFVLSEPQPDEFWRAIGQDPPQEQHAGSQPLAAWLFLPHLGEVRNFARLLDADSAIAIRDGAAGRFISNCAVSFALARHAEERPLLISQLVAYSIEAIAYDRINTAIGETPSRFSSDELEALDRALRAAHARGESRLDLTGERYFFEDSVQRMFTDDGEGNGQISAVGLAMMNEIDGSGGNADAAGSPAARVTAGAMRYFSSDRREVTELYDGLLDSSIEWASIPLWERPASMEGEWDLLDDAESFPPDIGMTMVAMVVPALSTAHSVADRLNQSRDATLAAVAIARWESEHGEWPGTLQELVPEYLDAVPIDCFDGASLRYRVGERGPLLYSIGADRDDDLGTSAEEAMRWIPAESVAAKVAQNPLSFDGDWVFLSSHEESDTDTEQD